MNARLVLSIPTLLLLLAFIFFCVAAPASEWTTVSMGAGFNVDSKLIATFYVGPYRMCFSSWVLGASWCQDTNTILNDKNCEITTSTMEAHISSCHKAMSDFKATQALIVIATIVCGASLFVSICPIVGFRVLLTSRISSGFAFVAAVFGLVTMAVWLGTWTSPRMFVESWGGSELLAINFSIKHDGYGFAAATTAWVLALLSGMCLFVQAKNVHQLLPDAHIIDAPTNTIPLVSSTTVDIAR